MRFFVSFNNVKYMHKAGFVNIVGNPNVGKSTLMNMLGCLDVPTNGIYKLAGQDVSHLTDDELSDSIL